MSVAEGLVGAVILIAFGWWLKGQWPNIKEEYKERTTKVNTKYQDKG